MKDLEQPPLLGMAVFNAIYSWLADKGYRVYVYVPDSRAEGVMVPERSVGENGSITLCISPNAVLKFSVTVYGIGFEGRFNGMVSHVSLPWGSFSIGTPDADIRPFPFPAFPFYEFNGKEPIIPGEEQPPKGKPKLSVVK